MSDCLSTSVTVTAKLATVVVRATSASPDQCYEARVPVPPGVLRNRLRAFLSVDGVLTVEAPLVDGDVVEALLTTSDEDASSSGNKWTRAKSALTEADGETPDSAEKQTNGNTSRKDDHGEADDAGDKDEDGLTSPAGATSPAEGQAGAPSKEKVGVPIFRDELGTRRMYLAVELGTIYRPRDVIIQVTACCASSYTLLVKDASRRFDVTDHVLLSGYMATANQAPLMLYTRKEYRLTSSLKRNRPTPVSVSV